MADQIADALVNVAVSTGVDVVTKRSVDPTIRGLGNAYRVFSIVQPAYQVANAVRIAAYTDVTTIVCHELVVHFASQQLAKRLLAATAVNYEVLTRAKELVLSVDFAKDVPESVHYLGASQHLLEADLVSRDYKEYGRGLASIAHESISHGVDAYLKAEELVGYNEAKKLRKSYNFDRQEIWLDRLNHSLGHVLWRPVPEIGLGMNALGDGKTYFGTFRKNNAEGYGCMEWSNGSRYFGQIRDGNICGYGGYHFPDGGRYFGFWPSYALKSIGAYITPNRDRVIFGVGRGRYPNSYGRQIGLRDGVQSVSGFWHEGELVKPIQSMEQTNKEIAEGMTSPFTTLLKAEYEGKARMDRANQNISDAALLTSLRPFV